MSLICLRLTTAKERRLILDAYRSEEGNGLQRQAVSYIKCHGAAFRPYSWAKEYMCRPVTVIMDDTNGLHYVLHHDRRLYFPKGWAKCDIFKLYNELCLEQDPRSAHCYFTSDFQPEAGSVLVDVGASEGMTALENIDNVSKCILIECEPGWVEALTATFAPYHSKVTIVPKFASDVDNETSVTLDSLLKQESDLCIKMDVEGFENPVLQGAREFLSSAQNSHVKIAVCLYHQWNDQTLITDYLSEYFSHLEIAPNYVCMPWDYQNGTRVAGHMPYLRSAVLRAWN